jgi:aminoglycoside 6'-N-acetyltransferase I
VEPRDEGSAMSAKNHAEWIEARKRYGLSNVHIQMARELGLNPRKLGGKANHRQERWKVPLPEWIASLYEERFHRAAPLEVLPPEQWERAARAKKIAVAAGPDERCAVRAALRFEVRHARADDVLPLARLRATLWPDGSESEHASELQTWFAGEPMTTLPYAVLVAADADDATLIGFAEVGLRSHAEGCDPKRAVGFLEGWFVVEQWRKLKVGTALLAAAEDWARAQGCTEMGSDTWLSNSLGRRAHLALGFEEVEQLVCFRKSLAGG